MSDAADMSEDDELELLRLRKQKAMATAAHAARGFGGITGKHGASGDFGYPDPGLPMSLLAKLVQGGSKDSIDEGMGAGARLLGSGSLEPAQGKYLKLPTGETVSMQTPEDVQRSVRDYVRQIQEGADQHHKWPGMAAQMLGEGASDFALAGPKMLSPGYQTLAGLYRGLMGNNTADLTREWTPGSMADAGMSTVLGGALGYGTSMLPAGLKAAGESGVAQSLANTGAGKQLLELAGKAVSAPGHALDYAGNKVQDLAGWLKVNSLHPVPTIAEDMAELPGGVSGVGKTLLAKNIGGFTKKGTAKQAAAALAEASANIDRTAAALDATGAETPDLAGVTNQALWRDAVPRAERPLTRTTGEKLGNTLAEYTNIYDQQPANFSGALNFRRELDDAIYKGDEFGASPELSDFAKALRPARADVNSAMLGAAEDASPELAEQFKNANLETRQLGYATRAAQRSAGRTAGNHLLGIKDMLAAGLPTGAAAAGIAMHHTKEGALAALVSWLTGKYGSQIGARSLYGLGGALKLPMRGLAAPAMQELLSRRMSLLDALGPEYQAAPSLLASGGDQ